VIQQHHASGIRSGFGGKSLRTDSGEFETRHDVGNDDHVIAVDLADSRFAIYAVGDRNERVRMGVVHIGIRQNSMQDGLHRRNRCRGARLMRDQLVDHLRIRQLRQLCQFLQVFQWNW